MDFSKLLPAIAWLTVGLADAVVLAQPVVLDGVKVSLNPPADGVQLKAERLETFKLRLDVARNGVAAPVAIVIDFPGSGPHVWPAADVEVRDPSGKALQVQRTGIEWFKMLVPLPAGINSIIVQAVEPADKWPRPTTEKQRSLQDAASAVRLRIARWSGGRTAALSIRFDDSHPTHLTKAAPILDEYGFPGTFMVNPGGSEPGSRRVSDFEQHQKEWAVLAAEGRHELANHSAHHRGGFGDEDVEAEIGEAAADIRKLAPGKIGLMALNLGGGTRWVTSRTLRYYLDKYQLFDASQNSTGMDDSYGNRVENFRRILEQHLARGLWCRIHYHYIGDGLSSSESNFRAALDIAKQHQDKLWIAGMAEIYKYQAERDSAAVSWVSSDSHQVTFKLLCSLDAALYDQPLTVEMVLPRGWDRAKTSIVDSHGTALVAKPGMVEGVEGLRIDVPPREQVYTLRQAQ